MRAVPRNSAAISRRKTAASRRLPLPNRGQLVSAGICVAAGCAAVLAPSRTVRAVALGVAAGAVAVAAAADLVYRDQCPVYDDISLELGEILARLERAGRINTHP